MLFVKEGTLYQEGCLEEEIQSLIKGKVGNRVETQGGLDNC